MNYPFIVKNIFLWPSLKKVRRQDDQQQVVLREQKMDHMYNNAQHHYTLAGAEFRNPIVFTSIHSWGKRNSFGVLPCSPNLFGALIFHRHHPLPLPLPPTPSHPRHSVPLGKSAKNGQVAPNTHKYSQIYREIIFLHILSYNKNQ